MATPSAHAAEQVGHNHHSPGAICIDHVYYRYPDGTLALEDITLHMTPGSTLALVGPNGAGKTTLLKIILGILTPSHGQARVFDMAPAEARRRGDIIGWVPQRPSVRWDFPVSLRQVVRMGLAGKTGVFRRCPAEDLVHVEYVLDILGIAHLANRPIGDLSGGQQQRAIIARALAPRPKILMLDEPMVGVDQQGRRQFSDLMRSIKGEFDVTLVMVSHDLQAVLSDVHRLACLDRTLHFHDTPDHLTDALTNKLFHCNVQALFSPHQEREGSSGEQAEATP